MHLIYMYIFLLFNAYTYNKIFCQQGHMDFSFQNLSDFIKSTYTCIILLRRSREAGTVFSPSLFINNLNYPNEKLWEQHNPTMKTVQVRLTVLILCFRTDTLGNLILGKQQQFDHCVQYILKFYEAILCSKISLFEF